jgi:hypothetical protein
MNTDDLRLAYQNFAQVAARAPRSAPVGGGWSAEMILAHVLVGDRLIAESAARTLNGLPTRFDNGAALVESYLQAVIDAARPYENLVSAVIRGGDELIGLVERMTDAQAAICIPAGIVSDGQVVLDREVPIGSLVRGPADVHLRLHSEQLAALAGAGAHGSRDPVG